MGDRGVITTQKDLDEGGVGVYLHWLGAPEYVCPMLEYCRIRGFRLPEEDSYGYARLVQVASNMSGGDGLSVGVNRLEKLDTENWNNGTYLVRGWKVEKRLYVSDQRPLPECSLDDLIGIDREQPESQRIGDRMLEGLLANGLSLPEAANDYHLQICQNRFGGFGGQGFREGETYRQHGFGKKRLKVVDIRRDRMTVLLDGVEREALRFFWKDGTESAYVVTDDGKAITAYSVEPERSDSLSRTEAWTIWHPGRWSRRESASSRAPPGGGSQSRPTP